jgi:hypothetical protein
LPGPNLLLFGSSTGHCNGCIINQQKGNADSVPFLFSFPQTISKQHNLQFYKTLISD